MPQHHIPPEIRNYVDYVVKEACATAVKEALKEHRDHFDEKFEQQNEKIDPMYTYFSAAKTNMIAFKWMVGIGGSVILIWQGIKEWLK